MSEKDPNGPDSGRETGDISQIQENLKKIGFQDVSDDRVKKILGSNENNGFMRDIEALLQNPPPDENEKNRFETLYLKGYGQMVDTPFGRLSFAEIAGLSAEKKEKSINGMTRMEKIAFKEWELQIANQKVAVSQSELINEEIRIKNDKKELTTKKEVRKGINEELINEEVRIENDKKELINEEVRIENDKKELIIEKDVNEGARLDLVTMNENLGKQILELQNIESIPKPDINNLRAVALENPPTIQGKPLSQADIESNRYDNIILANYYVKEEVENRQKINNPTDRIQFEQAMKGIKDTLRGSPVDKLYALTESKVLGSLRDEINARGEKIIESNNIKNISWNANTREITLKTDTNTHILETASSPPRERIVRGAITISQDIPRLSKEEKEEKRIRGEREIGESELARDAKRFRYAKINEIPTGLQEHDRVFNEYYTAKNTFIHATDTEGGTKHSDIHLIEHQKLLSTLDAYKKKNRELDTLTRQNTPLDDTRGQYEQIGNELDGEYLSIRELEKSLEKVISLEKELQVPTISEGDRFASNARYNIEALSRLGIARSFLNMDEVSAFIETQRGSHTSSLWGEKRAINTFLGREKLSDDQLRYLLSGLVTLHDTLRQDKVAELTGSEAKVIVLNRDEGDGRIKLQKTLDSYRSENTGGRQLTREDFERILREKNTRSD